MCACFYGRAVNVCFVSSCLISHAAPKSSPNWWYIQAPGEATLGNSNTFSWQQFERNQEQPALLGVSAVVYPATRRVFLPLSFPFSGARDGVAAQESVVGNTFRPLLCHRTIPPSPKDMNSWSRANHGLDMCLTGHTILQRLGQDVYLDLKSWTRREHWPCAVFMRSTNIFFISFSVIWLKWLCEADMSKFAMYCTVSGMSRFCHHGDQGLRLHSLPIPTPERKPSLRTLFIKCL